MMCRQCVLVRKESLQSNEICDTFGVKPVCNLYKIASGLCVFFSCTRPLLVFLWSQLHWVQSSIYVDGLWVLLILIFALDGMDQGSNYHTLFDGQLRPLKLFRLAPKNLIAIMKSLWNAKGAWKQECLPKNLIALMMSLLNANHRHNTFAHTSFKF